MLLEATGAPEDLAMLAEVPLERLQNMAEGALCSDETAYHLEQQLELPSGWLDRMNSAVPEKYLTLLANPHHRQNDDDTSPSSDARAPALAALPSSSPSPTPAPASASPAPVAPPAATAPQPLALLPAATISAAPLPQAQSGEYAKIGTPVTPVSASPALETAPPVVAPEAVPESSAPAAFQTGAKPAADPQQQSLISDVPPSQPQDQASAAAPAGLLSQPEKEPAMTTPTELRRENLNVLLSGKGAKSAMARLLGLSPASITGMLNGVKPLDKELLHNVAKATHLPDTWFDKERTEADIPATALKLLSPLVRGATAPPAAPKARLDSKPPESTPPAGPNGDQGGPDARAAAPSPAPKPAPRAQQTEDKPKTWPSQGTKVSRLLDSTSSSAAAAPAAAGGSAPQNAAPAAKATPPAATPASPAPTESTRQSREVPEQQRGDSYAGMTAVLSESVLPPIAEALIKTLAQKASSGALSEDKAFELLGSVRAL